MRSFDAQTLVSVATDDASGSVEFGNGDRSILIRNVPVPVACFPIDIIVLGHLD